MDKCPTEMRDEELWQLFPIILVPYDASWPEAYRSESLRLREAVGSNIVRISHIGSTTVPGLTAKPTIDILLGKKTILPCRPCPHVWRPAVISTRRSRRIRRRE